MFLKKRVCRFAACDITLKKRSFNSTEADQEKFDEEWNTIFSGLKKLMGNGVDATSDATKPFALKAREMITLFTGGDKSIQQGLEKMYAQEGGGQMLRNHGLDVSDALYDYYEKALHQHFVKEAFNSVTHNVVLEMNKYNAPKTLKQNMLSMLVDLVPRVNLILQQQMATQFVASMQDMGV